MAEWEAAAVIEGLKAIFELLEEIRDRLPEQRLCTCPRHLECPTHCDPERRPRPPGGWGYTGTRIRSHCPECEGRGCPICHMPGAAGER
jgi:hypothetical protein